MNLIGILISALAIVYPPHEQITPLKEAARMVPRDNVAEETGSVVTVTGVVTVPSTRTDGSLVSFIQSGAAGIQLFEYEYKGPSLFVGDSVVATGRLGMYYGQEEIQSPRIRIVRRGVRVHPIEATVAQVRDGTYHGVLVRCRGKVIFKRFMTNGVSIYFTGSGGDTASAYVDFRMDPQMDASEIAGGMTVYLTGVSTRFSYKRPFTNGNDLLLRSIADVKPVPEGLLARFSGRIEFVFFILLFIVASLVAFTLLLRVKVRQKTRQLEEQARILKLFFDSVAELTGLLDRKQILSLALQRGNSLVGARSIIFGETFLPDREPLLAAFELDGDRLVIDTGRIGKNALAGIFKRLSGADALWNITVDRLVQDNSEDSDSLLDFFRRHLRGNHITAASPGDTFFVAFDHAGPISRIIPREIIKSYILHVYSAYRAAELFDIVKEQGSALERLYNNSVFGLLTISERGTIMTANRIALQLFGDESMTGKNVSSFMTSEAARRFDDLLASVGSSGREKFVRFAAELKTVHGHRDVEFAVQYDPSSSIFYTTVQDTSDRQSYENYAAKEKKIETLEKLASSLTHDLNNIVGSITGYASLLKRKLSRDSREYHYADIIENSSRRTTELIKEVLGFAQLDAKSMEVLDINRFVSETTAEFRKAHGDKYSILLTPYPDPVYARIATPQLKQVMFSVLTNAAESMEGGGTIECSIGLGPVPDPAPAYVSQSDYCFIEIVDHGIGMDDAIKRRIFEPFFTTKRVKKYTGLSMSMAYNILKHHRGFINVDSESGKGTKIGIFLPRLSEMGEPAAKPRKSANFDSKGIKLLVVDDEEGVRQLACDILNEQGYTVITASNGVQALERLSEHPDVRLVVLDMVMPGMGGKDTCIQIKRKPNPPKVLICTGYSELSELESILGKHADGLLQKPYSTGDMASAVESLLGTSLS